MNMKQLSLELQALQGVVSNMASMMEKIAAMQNNAQQAAKIIQPPRQHEAPHVARDYDADLESQPWRLPWESFKEYRSTCRPTARSRYLATVLERELGRRTGFVEAQLYDEWRKETSDEDAAAVWQKLGHKGVPKAL